jgi:nitrite reductase/ring-hydroxylating ferredoxin subunit
MSDTEGYSQLIGEKELEEGKMVVVRAEGKAVLFIKQDGKIYVVDDRCPHMGCKFSGGSLDGEVVICPCHEWRFNLESGEYEKDPDYMLTAYPFKIVDGKIWVKLEEDL